jgi:hypothetical protein
MRKAMLAWGIALIGIAAFAVWPALAKDGLEWTVLKRLNLEAEPLDVSTSDDGKWIFVLTPGEVLVYPAGADQAMSRISVGKEFDKVTHSPTNDTLVLSSRSGKSLQIVRLEFIRDISVAGLPFKGPENATVTITVFDDYQ